MVVHQRISAIFATTLLLFAITSAFPENREQFSQVSLGEPKKVGVIYLIQLLQPQSSLEDENSIPTSDNYGQIPLQKILNKLHPLPDNDYLRNEATKTRNIEDRAEENQNNQNKDVNNRQKRSPGYGGGRGCYGCGGGGRYRPHGGGGGGFGGGGSGSWSKASASSSSGSFGGGFGGGRYGR